MTGNMTCVKENLLYARLLQENQTYQLDNVTPADVFYGRQKEILERREQTRKKTIRIRSKMYENVVDQSHNQEYVTITRTVS